MHPHRSGHTTPAKPAPTPPTIPTKTAQPAVSGNKGHSDRLVCADDIRLCAYRKWERAGWPAGDGVQFWLEAEHELMHGA